MSSILGFYRGLGIYDVRGSMYFVLNFALPPFPSLFLLEGIFQNKNRTFDIITPLLLYCIKVLGIWLGTEVN